jgi:rhamnulose-1-phosphate aldolase
LNDLLKDSVFETESYPYFELPVSYPALKGACFFITGTGKRMRDLARKPMKNALIIKLNAKADGYWIISRKLDTHSFIPSSELPTHLSIHQMIARRGSSEKVVFHTHATELIALTHAKEFCTEEALNKLLWSMHPETMTFVPKGVGVVPFKLPGTTEIASETIKALENHDVALWEKHGVFAIGESINNTFDVIDILAKSAKIYFMCRSANIVPDLLAEEQLAELKLMAALYSKLSS